MIPKKIWQTHKTKFPPQQAINCIKSWITKNPDYDWYYFDDEKCEQFIKDHFNTEFVEMYNSLPYGVMKSDTWRIAIVYVYGGVYADLDTICVKPINSWTNEKDLVISIEPPTETGIVNFCFAAKEKHPALYFALEYLMKHYNSSNFLDKIEKTGTPIQNFGQAAFANGIMDYLKLNPDDRKTKLYKLDENAFSHHLNEKTLVHHRTASSTWLNYDSWRLEQKRDYGY